MDGRVGVSERRMTSAETELRSYNFIATRNKNKERAAVGIGNSLVISRSLDTCVLSVMLLVLVMVLFK
jgi:hypothetical protein